MDNDNGRTLQGNERDFLEILERRVQGSDALQPYYTLHSLDSHWKDLWISISKAPYEFCNICEIICNFL
jgi:hypothetical protein